MSPFLWVAYQKNHLWGTFVDVQSVWNVVWPSRLLSRMTMTLRMSARTHNAIWSCINFFRRFKVGPLLSKRLTRVHFPLKKWVSNRKNALQDAFWGVENDWDVVRSYRLVSWIPYDLSMSARTYIAITSDLQNFLEHIEDPQLISENGILTGFASKRLWNDHETRKITREVRLDV